MKYKRVSVLDNAKSLFNFEGIFNSFKNKAEADINEMKSSLYLTVDKAHSFNLTPVIYLDGEWKKASVSKGDYAEGIAVKINSNKYLVLIDGIVTLPTGVKDDEENNLVDGKTYALSQIVIGKLHENDYENGVIQPLLKVVTEKGVKKAVIRLERPIIL